MTGTTAAMTHLCVAVALVVTVVVGVRVWTYCHLHRARPRGVDPDTVEACQAYRRYLVAASRAGGSRRDWDYSVRPVLAELVEFALAERTLGESDPQLVAQEYLGAELWHLTTRGGPRSENRTTPGPGRDTLIRILERMEDSGGPVGALPE